MIISGIYMYIDKCNYLQKIVGQQEFGHSGTEHKGRQF